MTLSPLSPEAVAQMVADREAGTPGPWQFQIETDQDGYDECVYVTADIVTIHWSNLGFGADEYDTRVDDAIKANASRIARLPGLEAAYLTLAAENATLRAGLEHYKSVGASTLSLQIHEQAKIQIATLRASEAAALGRAKLLETTLQRIAGYRGPYNMPFPDALPEYPSFAVMEARQALTPTADKEPKT